MDEELETKIGAVMCVHMDANVMRSQLRYRPIFGCFVYFRSICLCSLLSWPGPCYVSLALPTELRARLCLV